MSGRQREFRINYGHELARDAVFLGLGRHTHSTHYHDSSLRYNHGTITAASLSSLWVWDNELNQSALDFAGGTDWISLPFFPTAPSTFSCFLTSHSDSGYCIVGQWDNPGSTWLLYAGIGTPAYLRNSGAGGEPSATISLTQNVCKHIAWTNDGSASAYYVDGVLAATGGGTTFGDVTNGLQIGKWSGGYHMNARISSPTWHNRVLSQPEIASFADPSNYLLSGLIVPERKWWPAVVAGTPPAVSSRLRQVSYIGMLGT